MVSEAGLSHLTCCNRAQVPSRRLNESSMKPCQRVQRFLEILYELGRTGNASKKKLRQYPGVATLHRTDLFVSLLRRKQRQSPPLTLVG